VAFATCQPGWQLCPARERRFRPRPQGTAQAAVAKLAEAGWKIGDGVMKNSGWRGAGLHPDHHRTKSRKRSPCTINARWNSAIGVKADVRLIDAAQFASVQKTYDYDMIPATWFNSLSPGNEQKLYFGSSGKTTEGTRNYPGIADPRVDAAIEACLPPRRVRNSNPRCAPRTACWSRATT
jgi:peptide/nickel transport system substrate-binding protein